MIIFENPEPLKNDEQASEACNFFISGVIVLQLAAKCHDSVSYEEEIEKNNTFKSLIYMTHSIIKSHKLLKAYYGIDFPNDQIEAFKWINENIDINTGTRKTVN